MVVHKQMDNQKLFYILLAYHLVWLLSTHKLHQYRYLHLYIKLIFPCNHYSSYIYNHVTQTLQKHVISYYFKIPSITILTHENFTKKTQTTYHCKLSKQKQLLPKQPSLEPSLFCFTTS